MKTIITLFLIFLLAVTAFGETPTVKSQGSKMIEKLTGKPVDVRIPRIGLDVERVVLANGMIVYLYENDRLPTLSLTTMIRCGSVYDSKEKDGLSQLVGTVMRTGGSTSISGDSLNILLEYAGAMLETRIGDEFGTASLSVLSKDLDLGLKLWADLLRNPAFPADKLELAKVDIRNSIKRRNDDPGSVTNRYFNHLIYGDHPNGRILEWASIKAITPEDLFAYHRMYFVPNNMIVGIAGDFRKDELIAKLNALVGDWQKSETIPAAPPEVIFGVKPGVYEVLKDVNQANIRIGQMGIRRDNPDRYAISLMNYILGGGSFTSRLTSRVRSDEGLAYRAGSSFDIDSRDYGVFAAFCQTKSSTCYKATKIIMEEISKIRAEGATQDELDEARNAAINRFVFNFDTSGRIIQNLISLEYNGYPTDYYDTYIDNVSRVTLADIKSVAEKYFDPSQMTFVVVGKPETFDKPLSEFGQVTTIELTEPVLE
ncbi:MAG: insulinase family protein [candidate division Zixibacteria bacterium]|nr:insulinase family protein [candidate division Zixibacteria bacterium]